MKTCAFCSNDAVEHGGEHIWDRWLNDWLPASGHEVRYLSVSGISRRYSKKTADAKLPVVCEPCNSGFMSRVTNCIKDNFKYVIRDGAAICVLPSGIALLTAFTFMKAVVATHSIAESDEPFFTRRDKERFRESLAVPFTVVKMWVGAFQGEASYSRRFNVGVVSPDPPGPLYGMEYFTFSYVVGHLVLQLCAGRWKDIHRRRPIVPMLRPNPCWDPACIQFWPGNGAPIEWPPPKYFNDASLKEFINRFQHPIDLRG